MDTWISWIIQPNKQLFVGAGKGIMLRYEYSIHILLQEPEEE